VNISNRLLWTVDKGYSSTWGLGEGLATTHSKNAVCYEILHRASELDVFSGTTKATESGSKN
jgi:hypothetical protein